MAKWKHTHLVARIDPPLPDGMRDYCVLCHTGLLRLVSLEELPDIPPERVAQVDVLDAVMIGTELDHRPLESVLSELDQSQREKLFALLNTRG